MAYDHAAVKARVRRTVHNTLGIAAEYVDDTMAAPEQLRVRWHNRIVQTGDLQNGGYAEIIDGINRVIFDIDELLLKGVIVHRGGRLKISAPAFNGAVLVIGERDSDCGPIEQTWYVGKL